MSWQRTSVVVYQGPGKVGVENIDYPKLELPDDVVKGLGVAKQGARTPPS